MRRQVIPLFMVVALGWSVAPLGAVSAPVTVSPGSAQEVIQVEARCPAFSWGAVERAGGYELVVYRLPQSEQEVAGDELAGAEGSLTQAEAALRERLPAGADAVSVVIDSAGQLGTISSSRRFKTEIVDMGEGSAGLLELRPVTFKYKREPVEGEQPVQFGLIAEEVAEVLPEFVVYNGDGQPETVRYHLLSSLLLNELKRQHGLNLEQEEELEHLRARLRRLEGVEAKTPPLSGRRPPPTDDPTRAMALAESGRR